MTNPNLALLEEAVELLEPLLNELVFAGGCATGLLVTDPAATGIRPTRDVDAITDVTSYAQYATLSERLRELGLHEDSSEDAPTCRWRRGNFILDVMPTDERILGFSNRWYGPAIGAAQTTAVGRHNIRVVTAPYFLSTKLEAFHGRGGQDYRGSHDLEDIITVVDGRPTLGAEVRAADADLRGYIATQASVLLNTRAFLDALPGHLAPDVASQGRLPILLSRMEGLSAASKPLDTDV
jgi:hypothetical protein